MEEHEKRDPPWTMLACGHQVYDPAQMHYCTYIGVAQLEKNLKPFERNLLHPDEHQFIIVHQRCELGFAEVLFEIEHIIALLKEEQYADANLLIARITGWMKAIIHDTAQLNTMPPANFLKFRDALMPASGAESIGSRLIEIRSGLDPDAIYTEVHGHRLTFRQTLDRRLGPGQHQPKTNWWTPQMEDATTKSSLWSTFQEVLAAHGSTLEDVYQSATHQHLRRLAHSLSRYEKMFLAWRKTHRDLTHRQIGDAPGGGVSEGVKYLDAVLRFARFFPALEELERRFPFQKSHVTG